MTFPFFLVITLLLLMANQGNPFFFQQRPGKKGRIFRVVKFKTMNDKKNNEGKLLPDGARLTKVGKFIRSTSLDEIPQLLNVINGDMSLVGPRPLLVKYLPLYNEVQARRHEVRPGITGWAQVNGRNAI
ncbi:MAG: sugar transferase, partial [Imperialibacter sp.]